MGNRWRSQPLKIRGLLFLGITAFFLSGDVFEAVCLSKGGGENFSEVNAFFKGSDQEVEVYDLFGKEKGPTVLIFAGIHGDESGGYLTADRYVSLKLMKGNLIVVPRLNLYAILTGKRTGMSGGDLIENFTPLRKTEIRMIRSWG